MGNSVSSTDRDQAAEQPDLNQGVNVRNEFSSVVLKVQSHGQGTRLEIRSTLFGTTALLDATILEALSRLDPDSLAELVQLAMTRWDEREHPTSKIS
jgi:hypothetical protein